MRAYGIGGRDAQRPTTRYALFDDWRELSTSPIFQMHRFTDAARKILEEGDYGLRGLHTGCVKAILVTAMTYVDGQPPRPEQLCISVKFPAWPEIARPGLLVYETNAAQPEQGAVVERKRDLYGYRDDLEHVAVPAPAGLLMTARTRVLSITPHKVRLFPTGAIDYANQMGHRDKANPPVPEIPADVLASLEELVLD